MTVVDNNPSIEIEANASNVILILRDSDRDLGKHNRFFIFQAGIIMICLYEFLMKNAGNMYLDSSSFIPLYLRIIKFDRMFAF